MTLGDFRGRPDESVRVGGVAVPAADLVRFRVDREILAAHAARVYSSLGLQVRRDPAAADAVEAICGVTRDGMVSHRIALEPKSVDLLHLHQRNGTLDRWLGHAA